MWRPSSVLTLSLVLAAVSGAARAVDLKLTQVAPTATSTTTIQPPAVTGFSPAGGCVNKGAGVVVLGKNFGTQSGKGIALGGQGIHVDLPVSSWSSASIGVTIPNDSRIQGGKWYYIGIEKADHSQWLSNIDKTVTICSAPAITVAPLKTPMLSTTPSTPTAPSGASGASRVPGTGAESPAEPEYADPGFAPTAPAGAGGSLLNAELPPPPKDVPPAPVKESAAIEPGELVVVSSNMAEAQQLAAQTQTLRLSVKRRSNLAGLGFVVTVFRVPKEVGVGNALVTLRKAQPNVWADANHRFQLMGDESKTFGKKLIGWSGGANCGNGMRIGLVDTAVNATHPSLRGRKIKQQGFLSTGNAPGRPDHGTAVAALLVGNEIGLVPGAQLFVANIFRQREKQTDTTAEWVVLALNWLAENRAAVINLSLGGPRNLLLEAAIQRLLNTGVAVVAAAGNGGENAPPAYPAAQAGVVAVTGVDAAMSVYKNANRGDYVSFAAPGVDVWTVAPGRDGIFVSGTSYAAPFVTAALATARRANKKDPWPAIVKQLQSRARDLGPPGKDPVFGWGLLRTAGCGKS